MSYEDQISPDRPDNYRGIGKPFDYRSEPYPTNLISAAQAKAETDRLIKETTDAELTVLPNLQKFKFMLKNIFFKFSVRFLLHRKANRIFIQ